MGLKDLMPEDLETGSSNYRKYGSHEADKRLEAWFDEFQERFPTRVKVDFIEVSPELEKTAAKFYYREDDGNPSRYIRISEKTLNEPPWFQRQILLSTMVSAYLKQEGADELGAGHAIKKWIRGRVGCQINAVDIRSEEWQFLAEPFLDESLKPPLE